MNTESTTNNHLSIINNHLAGPFSLASSQNVTKVRKIHPFLTNKANFKKVKFYVTIEMIRDYEQMDTWSHGKNKANSKPNKANLKKAKMNVTKLLTKNYEKLSNWAIYKNKPNFDPKQTQFEPNFPALPCQIYPTSRPRTTNSELPTNNNHTHETIDNGVLKTYINGLVNTLINTFRNGIADFGQCHFWKHDLWDKTNYEDLRTNQ